MTSSKIKKLHWLNIKDTNPFQWGGISCEFLPPGGSTGPSYVLQLYLVKNHKIADNSAITEAREKFSTYLESLEFSKFVGACLTKFENYQILHNKISHRWLVTTKLFSGWKSLIDQVSVRVKQTQSRRHISPVANVMIINEDGDIILIVACVKSIFCQFVLLSICHFIKLSATTLSMTALSITTFSIMTLSKVTFSIMTLSIKGYHTQHKWNSA